MNKGNLFVKTYNEQNNIYTKDNLDIYDECSFSYLDILKNKEVEVCTPESTRLSIVIAEAEEKSARTGKIVAVKK